MKWYCISASMIRLIWAEKKHCLKQILLAQDLFHIVSFLGFHLTIAQRSQITEGFPAYHQSSGASKAQYH